jgi:hypothetical protein
MSLPRRKKHFMTTAAYFVVADVIRKIADPAIRKQMADHFATEFNRRSPSFSPYDWERATGGKVAANSAKVSA